MKKDAVKSLGDFKISIGEQHRLSERKTAGSEKTKTPEQIPKQKNKSVLLDNRDYLVLSRPLLLTCYPVIATLKVMQDRPDIAMLLKQEEPQLPPRLSAYLKKLDVISEEGELTELGRQVITTKQLPTIERGLYHIWYCHEDPLIADRPLLIQRINAFSSNTTLDRYKILHNKEDVHRLRYVCKEQFSCKAYNGLSQQQDDLVGEILDVEVVCQHINKSQATLIWGLSDRCSDISINGQLSIQQQSKNQRNSVANIECTLKLTFSARAEQNTHLKKVVASVLNGEWNEKTKLLQLPLQDLINNYNSLDQFTLSELPTSELATQTLGKFSVKQVSKLAIQPLQGTEIYWQEAWVKHFYDHDHVTPLDADSAQQRWLKNKAVIDYDIAPLTQHSILQLLQKNGKTRAFWHAAASIDLVPDQAKGSALPLHLSEGDCFSFTDVVSHLTGGESIERLIISDRYYQTNLQKRLLFRLFSSTRCDSGVLFTSKNQNNQSLPENWQFEFFEHKRPENHDRYWIFQTARNIHAWKLSTGLDFAEENANDWQVKGHPSFTPIVKSNLPEYLKVFIETFSEEAAL
ncbi:hypothetical protein [Neptunomonas qingdaonensis]|uniref:Uncharacterized protein n=1 Tax=Neptunomonas qingdaonensis TaxID=1045558 RepID=A0A1I2TTB7_9GAMM|nr:hypothetical protein [Neptunomonas qingdaonensis]SFG68098.1 hypothetical protein SAMN05216175_1117 [Neptunomonas qingdaonensis]